MILTVEYALVIEKLSNYRFYFISARMQGTRDESGQKVMKEDEDVTIM